MFSRAKSTKPPTNQAAHEGILSSALLYKSVERLMNRDEERAERVVDGGLFGEACLSRITIIASSLLQLLISYLINLPHKSANPSFFLPSGIADEWEKESREEMAPIFGQRLPRAVVVCGLVA